MPKSVWLLIRACLGASNCPPTNVFWNWKMNCCYAITGRASVAEQVLATSLPSQVPPAPILESVLALILLAFLITSIRFQDGEPGFLSVAYKRRLYVHALNGFYMNTLANLAARRLGLMPQKR